MSLNYFTNRMTRWALQTVIAARHHGWALPPQTPLRLANVLRYAHQMKEGVLAMSFALAKEFHPEDETTALERVIPAGWAIFIIGSMLGWAYETVNDLICGRGFMLRQTLIGPWCPIYGIGMLLIVICCGKIAERKPLGRITPLLVFVLIGLLTTSLELASSYLLETVTGSIPWNYSDYFMNFEGRVALKSSMIFMVGGTAYLYFIHPRVRSLLDGGNPAFGGFLLATFALFMCDNVAEWVGVNAAAKDGMLRFGRGAITIQGG